MSASPLRLGIVGFGKIARDEHVPAIAAHGGAELVAVASPHGRADGLPGYETLDAMLTAHPEIAAVVLCQPPAARYEAAHQALAAGRHVFLEKPPGATLGEVEMLSRLAEDRGLTLFAGWHSRWAPQVRAARAWCAGRQLTGVRIEWKEDVRLWHPGQEWIWEAGGFGVFDPGLNALSIVTEVLREPLRLVEGALDFPANRQAPIAAELSLVGAGGVPLSAVFDWRQTGPQIWRITFEAGADRHEFQQGGADAVTASAAGAESTLSCEYKTMYRHFVGLVDQGISEVDVQPLRIVADAFLRAERRIVASFD